MQKISSITPTATPDGLFTNGSVASGVSPTILDAAWFNTVQEELVGVVQGAGLTLDPNNNNQLFTALKNLFNRYYVDSGVANALVITPVPALTALADGQVFDICCAAANTGAVTLKVGSLNAYPVWGAMGALQGGEIANAKGVIRVVWSASNNAFLITGQNTGGSLAVGPASKSVHALQLGQAVGRLLNVQLFAQSGQYIPTPGTTMIIVELVGGSGASGGAYSATGSTQSVCTSPSCEGAYAMAKYANPVSTPVTIGAGGAAVMSGPGGAGGTSRFGSLLTCPGGGGSYAASPSNTTITPSLGATAAAPTGSGILTATSGRYPQNAIQASFGVCTNYAPGAQGPMPGSLFGASVPGIYLGANQAAIAGNNGIAGACRIWEYS